MIQLAEQQLNHLAILKRQGITQVPMSVMPVMMRPPDPAAAAAPAAAASTGAIPRRGDAAAAAAGKQRPKLASFAAPGVPAPRRRQTRKSKDKSA
jgi:hypothetical protein